MPKPTTYKQRKKAMVLEAVEAVRASVNGAGQRETAKRLVCHERTIERYCNGETKPTVFMAERILSILGAGK